MSLKVDSRFDRTPSLTISEYTPNDPIPSSPIHVPSSFQKLSVSTSAVLRYQPKLKGRADIPPHESVQKLLESIVTQPRILSSILKCCTPTDFRALSSTCQYFRNIFQYADIRDVVLCRYVPGYRACRRNVDLEQVAAEVVVTVSDLQLFLISERIGLHVYPMHALALLSVPTPSIEQFQLSIKFGELTAAHSRFVLLLQAITHSSTASSIHELEDVGLKLSVPVTVKELRFPEPLSYYNLIIRNPVVIPRGLTHIKRHPKKARIADVSIGHERPPKRYSFLWGVKSPPPPPPSDNPAALREYSSSWRRTVSNLSWRQEDDDFGSLKLPQRRFASTSHSHSSASSLSPASSSSSPVRSNWERERFSPAGHGTSSPHDFALAFSRTHAPVLRVFVPCTRLDDVAIATCEDYLADSGLWEILSTGDIVCNLGYIPAVEQNFRNEWLLFNGSGLVRYCPPDPPPVRDALTLPSPFYYSHLLPSLANPIFALNLPPHFPPNMLSPTYTLTPVQTKVRSPTSSCGFAMVKRYKWLAYLKGPRIGGVSYAWQTQWVMESEGTSEGRSILEYLITGRQMNELWLWEVDRDKSSQSRLWLRLLGPTIASAPLERDIDC